MPVAYRAASGGADLSPALPPGTALNDIVLAIYTGPSAVAVEAPTNWTPIQADLNLPGAGSAQHRTWWARQTALELGTTWTDAGAGGRVALVAYSGCMAADTPVEATSYGESSGGTLSLPSITTRTAGCMIVALINQATAGAHSASSFTNTRLNQSATAGGITLYDDGLLASPGATGVMTVTSTGGGMGGTLVALQALPATMPVRQAAAGARLSREGLARESAGAAALRSPDLARVGASGAYLSRAGNTRQAAATAALTRLGLARTTAASVAGLARLGLTRAAAATTALVMGDLERRAGASARLSRAGLTVQAAAAAAVTEFQPPVFALIDAAMVDETTARVTWASNEPTISDGVDYGPILPYPQQRVETGAFGTQHALLIPDLIPGLVYHYRVRGTDLAGNAGYSEDYTFTAASPPPATPQEDLPENAYEVMRSWLPPLYANPGVVDEVLRAQGAEIDALSEAVAETLDQAFARRATWNLPEWEAELGLAPLSGLTAQQRQDRLVSQIRGYGTATIQVVKLVAESYEQGEVDIIEDFPGYRITVQFVDTRGTPPSLADLQRAVRQVVPAHLDLVYQFGYVRWSEVDAAALTWRDVDYMNRTWAQWDTSKTFTHAP